MIIDEEMVINWYDPQDYIRGREYYQQHRVRNYHAEESANRVFITCTVRGTSDYSVTFYYTDTKLVDHCTCPQFERTGSCKHMVAALLEHINRKKTTRADHSDWRVRRILEAYQPGSTPHVPDSGSTSSETGPKIRLQPILRGPFESGAYPFLALKVGAGRMYVIRNIRDFLDRMEKGTQFSYGKNLTFRHTMHAFDSTSQALIALLQDNLEVYRTVYSNYLNYYAECNIKSDIQLTGSSFDRFFALYREQEVPYDDGSPIHLCDRNPTITLRVSERGSQTLLEFPELSDLNWFGTGKSFYVLQGRLLMHATEQFSTRMRPLLERAGDSMALIPADLLTFCSCVLPVIRDFVTIEDPKGLLEKNSPDVCTPCFYFDMDQENLLCRLTLRYGSCELEPAQLDRISTDLRRDLLTEQSAKQQLEQYFTWNPATERYMLTGDDEIFQFLSQSLEQFRAFGEIFVSDRIESLELQPSSASVGISVSDGLLHLELDTGGVPLEELEAIYQSMLRRRKYHRLKDGRFLVLDGSPVESVAEAVHMSQLSTAELKQGSVTLPAYRGLYLDSVLGDCPSLEVTRDTQFRNMVQKFHTVQESDYPIPEKFTEVLRPYQKTGYRWLKTLESCGFGGILADEMGLGKTLQMIAYFSTVTNAVTGKPNLVVCPASLVLNWGEELQRFAPDLKVCLIMGTAAQRAELISSGSDCDVWVTSYDLLKRDLEKFRTREFYCCTLDEGQFIKNQSTQASRAVKAISCTQRFVMTGTPIENRLSELWNLFDFIMPGYLFSHNRFVERLERPIVKAQDEQAQKMLAKLVQPFLLRRLKKDVLTELPPKLEYTRKIALSQDEQKLYAASVLATKTKLAGSTEKLQILAALTQLRQICCNPSLCYENYHGEASKLEACMELVRSMSENGHQILLFSQFTSMLDILQQRLLEEQISCYLLEGSTPKETRAKLVHDFNDGRAQVFLISLKAGGTGLNLTAADVVIHYDPWWNLAAQNQATDRAHRIGQTACVQVYKLITAGTIEEKILELQDRKAQLMETLSCESDSILSMNREELLSLLD